MPRAAIIDAHAQLGIAGALVIRSRVFFDAWFLSAGVEGRDEYRSFWDGMWSFWRFNEHALLFSYIVHMANLFEARNDTVNLRKIWRLHESHPRAESVKANVEDLFAKALKSSKSVTILRSNVMAHRSVTLSYNEAFRRARITPNDIRELTEVALEIVNEMRSLYDLHPEVFDELAIGELRVVAASWSKETEDEFDVDPS